MQLTEPVLDRVDDSQGDVGDVFRQACRNLGTIAAKTSPDLVQLADRVFEAITMNGYGAYDRLVEVVLPVLGEPGVARLKQRLTGALAERPKVKNGFDRVTSALHRALQDIAEGDVDTFIAHETGRRAPHGAAAIATRLLAADRAEEALVFLEIECAGQAFGSRSRRALGSLIGGHSRRCLGADLGRGAALPLGAVRGPPGRAPPARLPRGPARLRRCRGGTQGARSCSCLPARRHRAALLHRTHPVGTTARQVQQRAA